MNDHRHVYTKSRLIKELAFRAGIKKIASRQILEVLAEIIKRETPNGPFILPGLCKFELVPRKARRIRNPRTGELLIMPPQKALKITAARSAKLAIAPRIPAVPAALYVPPAVETPAPAVVPVPVPAPAAEPAAASVPAPAPVDQTPPAPAPAVDSAPASETVEQPVPAQEATPTSAPAEEPAPAPAAEPAPAPTPEPTPAQAPAEEPKTAPTAEPVAEPAPGPAPAPAPEPTPAPAPAPAPAPEEPQVDAISFKCPGCGQEIEAPVDAIGLDAECPMCGNIVVVPAKSEPGTMYGPSVGDAPKSTDPVVSAKEAEEMDPTQLKNRTIRIDAEALGLDDPTTPAKKEPVEEKLISFFCPNCHQEIEATADMAGTPAECPNCGLTFEVPFFSEAGSIHDEHRAEEESKASYQAQKGKTMRIDLPDDF